MDLVADSVISNSGQIDSLARKVDKVVDRVAAGSIPRKRPTGSVAQGVRDAVLRGAVGQLVSGNGDLLNSDRRSMNTRGEALRIILRRLEEEPPT